VPPRRLQLNKKLYTDITRLRLLDRDSADVRFRLQQSPFTGDEDEEELLPEKREDYVITGQIFPTSEIFRERSYLIEMKLTKTFPLDPPEIRFLTPMYHPNIDKDGNSFSLYSMKQ
jgi:ubiquitin-protein ligase